MKLGPLDDFIKALAYSLQNQAGGRIGSLFQFYVFLWIVMTSFFSVTRILALTERPDPIYLASAPIYVVLSYIPIHFFWIYEKNVGIEKRRVKEMQFVDSVNVEYKFTEPAEMGFKNALYLRINNPTIKTIENIWMRAVFPSSVHCDKPVLSLGSLEPMSSLTASYSFVPFETGSHSMGYYDLYLEIDGHEHQKPPIFFGNINIAHSYLGVEFEVTGQLKLGHPTMISIRMKNYSNRNLDNLHVKCSFPKSITYDTAFSDTRTMTPGASFDTAYEITPVAGGEIDLGYFDVMFEVEGNGCKIGDNQLGKYYVQIPEVDVMINMPDTLHSEVGNTIGIHVENRSDEVIANVCFNSCFTSFIECHKPNVCIPEIQPYSSGYVSLVIKPINSGKVDLGNLNFSFEVNEILFQKEPIDLGTHGVA
ncbi:hypothetical protein [Methanolobus profundi]|uniref:Uncharacterized protein n=1 Tax=Methanolobus profundi TaxID=487685 RepID=A0A1I4P7N1_9EURY|nr:hypothetical protein [Methanolobus profundi]SFM23635.1 hypothetical protein SAMN04488696_0488 [Methanolobus profundi]